MLQHILSDVSLVFFHCLLNSAMKKGYDRATVMGFKDKENNMPLHAAVNGGNLKVSQHFNKSK